MASFCTNCAAALDPGTKFCAVCGTPSESAIAPTAPATPRPVSAPVYSSSPIVAERGRYPVVRLCAVLLKIAAVLTGVMGIISAVGMSEASSMPFMGGLAALGALGGLFLIIWTLIMAVTMWGVAELMVVILNIDENTRMRPQSS
jgi:hypothetical protein